jgi:hypothetical protein
MDKLYDQITGKLLESQGVRKVEQLGSPSGSRDEWSDLDVGVLVDETSLSKYFPATNWILAFGDIFATNQSSSPGKATTRVVFHDLSRVDFTFVTGEEQFETSTILPSDEVAHQKLVEILNDFRFEVILAIAKFGREDLLIGVHLLLGIEQKCLILAMMLRDQEHRTVHHRRGGFMNEVADRLVKQQRLVPSDRIRASCSLFGELATRLDSKLEVDWSPIMTYLEMLDRQSRAGARD